MTAAFDVPPPRPQGGPTEPQPKPPSDVLIRRPDGSVHLVTQHARLLWDLLDDAIAWDRLDEAEVDAAIALGILMKWPVASLMRHKQRMERGKVAEAERIRQDEARRAWLNEVVMVTAAHPFVTEWSLDGQVVKQRVKPGETVAVTREAAQKLHYAARITRPNVISHPSEWRPAT